MATAVQAQIPGQATTLARARRRSFNRDRVLARALLSPSVVAIFVFVYGFIGYTVWVSLSNWKTNRRDLSLKDPLYGTYDTLFSQNRFQIDLRNTFVFTVIFLILSVAIGLGLAILLDRHVIGGGLFRSLFLFPYALSFITTGVVWRWMFNPETGVNLFFQAVGLDNVKPGWATDARVVGQINGPLERILPFTDVITADLGLPLALIPVTIAASWQLSGFAMAMYIAGMGGISGEVREAAQLDGASGWQLYRDVIIPLLKPITVSILVILGHVSLKIFDLVYAMTGKGPGFATDMPGIFVFDKMFGAQQYNLGAAASVVMLVLVSIVIVPYLARQLKEL
jgi:glucose/mannose transport system permease protein